MDGIVAAVTAPKAAGSRTGSLLSLLEDDPQWNGGDYYEHGPPKDTLIRIRREMLKKYGIEEWLQKKIPDRQQRQEAIHRMASGWAEEFDANSLIILSRALENFNTEPYFNKIKAKVLYVLSATDQLFPPSLAPGVMDKLYRAGVDAGYFEIDSGYGHLASGLEAEKWADRLRSFMKSLS